MSLHTMRWPFTASFLGTLESPCRLLPPQIREPQHSKWRTNRRPSLLSLCPSFSAKGMIIWNPQTHKRTLDMGKIRPGTWEANTMGKVGPGTWEANTTTDQEQLMHKAVWGLQVFGCYGKSKVELQRGELQQHSNMSIGAEQNGECGPGLRAASTSVLWGSHRYSPVLHTLGPHIEKEGERDLESVEH